MAGPSVATPADRAGFQESRPSPDPTELTERLVAKARLEDRAYLDSKLEAMQALIDRNQERLDELPALIDKDITTERNLTNEKLKGVEIQFNGIALRATLDTAATAKAVDAALSAQKEAIAKAEAGFTKQIDGIGALIATTAKGVDDKIDDVKGRVTAIESIKAGGQQNQTTTIAIIGAVAAVIAIGGFLFSQRSAPAPIVVEIPADRT